MLLSIQRDPKQIRNIVSYDHYKDSPKGAQVISLQKKEMVMQKSGDFMLFGNDSKEIRKMQKIASEMKMVLKKIQNVWYDIRQ